MALTTGDWINIGLLGAAVWALWYSALSVRVQARAADFTSYLDMQSRYAEAWRRYRDAQEEHKDFEFIEVLNLIEAGCHLHNKKVVYGATREMLESYLKEIISGILKNDPAKKRMLDAVSENKTFEQVVVFGERHNIPELSAKK